MLLHNRTYLAQNNVLENDLVIYRLSERSYQSHTSRLHQQHTCSIRQTTYCHWYLAIKYNQLLEKKHWEREDFKPDN